jgi:hypothetical protein
MTESEITPAAPRRHRATGNPPGRPRNLVLRREVRKLLDRPDPATGQLPTFSEVADRVGVSKQRVGQLAREWGIRGRAAGRQGGLRGRRRWARRTEDQNGSTRSTGSTDQASAKEDGEENHG